MGLGKNTPTHFFRVLYQIPLGAHQNLHFKFSVSQPRQQVLPDRLRVVSLLQPEPGMVAPWLLSYAQRRLAGARQRVLQGLQGLLAQRGGPRSGGSSADLGWSLSLLEALRQGAADLLLVAPPAGPPPNLAALMAEVDRLRDALAAASERAEQAGDLAALLRHAELWKTLAARLDAEWRPPK